jgi:hypothetical protein
MLNEPIDDVIVDSDNKGIPLPGVHWCNGRKDAVIVSPNLSAVVWKADLVDDKADLRAGGECHLPQWKRLVRRLPRRQQTFLFVYSEDDGIAGSRTKGTHTHNSQE